LDHGLDRRPTFHEFVRYLNLMGGKIFRRNFNEYWVPQFLSCELCSSKYDFIGERKNCNLPAISSLLGKYETIKDDIDHFLSKYGLQSLASLVVKNETALERFAKKGKFDTSLEYFSELTLAEAKDLYQIYQEDFQILDYNPNEYFSYTKQ